MKSERITLATDRREQPINFTEMLWSSQSTRWSGFRLEKHRIGPRGRLHDFSMPDILLGVCVSGSAQMHYERRGDTQHAVVRTGNFTLLNVGEQQRSIEWAGTRETLYIRVETAQLERYLPERADAGHVEVNPQYGIADPQVVRLAACMYDEAVSGLCRVAVVGSGRLPPEALRARRRAGGHRRRQCLHDRRVLAHRRLHPLASRS